MYKAYFIGGEWDGMQKRVNSRMHQLEVMKSNHVREKVRIFTANEHTITVEKDIYTLAVCFDDGVLIYRLRKEECNTELY